MTLQPLPAFISRNCIKNNDEIYETRTEIASSLFYDATKYRCQNGYIEGMLQKGEIPTVMISPDDMLYQKSLNSRYEKVGEAYHQGKQYDIYAFRNNDANVDSLVR